MKIILENNQENRITIETDAEVISEVLCEIRKALVAYSFHPKTVDQGFLEIAEDIEGGQL